MALALGLVGQPVQPYLTTGATDYVNSVQKGKEDAIKTEALKTTSQKSALDLLTAQKKQKDEQWYSDNAGALSRKVKTLDVADEDLAKMAQVNPEYHKVLQTERADAVKNFNASNLAYLGSSTDKAKSAQEIIQASEAHGMTIPDQFKQSPETLMQYLKVINAGSKAFDLKNVSKDESGDIITTDITGNTTDIKPAAVKAAKSTPVMVNGVPKTVKVPGTNDVKILNTDGTLSAGGSMPIPKTDKTADHPVYFNTTLTGDAFLKTLSPVDQAHVKALNEGREPFPTAKMMASNPYYERLADAVAQYNPDFDATAFSTRKNANTAFTTGIQGRQLLAFGSAVKHLETLGGLIDALKNKDTIQLNRLNNLWEKQTGQSAVTNFDAAKGIVAKEIMKSIVTGGGGVEERQELSKLMDKAQSPEQLRGVVDTYYELMKAQQENLIIQRDAAGLPRSSLPDYTKHSADEGKKPTGNQGAYQLYVQHWNAAKNNPALQKKLTDRAREMGIVK
jgi:hypothetical protein